jgi:hypothetical protein
MSETTYRLEYSLLEFLQIHHWDELECHGSRRLDIREKQASHGYHELVTKVSNALNDLLGPHGSGDETNVTRIPKCMRKRDLCDLHHQACLDFVCGPGGEVVRDYCSKLFSSGTVLDLTSVGRETVLDRDDGHEKLSDSHEHTDGAGQQLNDDADDDSDDDLECDLMGSPVEDSGDNEDDENTFLSSVDALDVAEYDHEEVIQKDQVSQRRRQCIIDQDDVRTLVSVSDLDDRVGSMNDSIQSGTILQADCMTPKFASEHSNGSPFTPKDDPSFLQRSYDTHSARDGVLAGQFQLSPNSRTLRTVTTLSADPSYDEEVELNEKDVRQLIVNFAATEGNSPADAKAGYVYAFRDNELSLIKFGRTLDLEARKSHIERTCGFVKGVSLVAAVKVKAHKRLEKIIHQDLAPHRRFFDCMCGRSKRSKGFTRHQEWFQIDDNTALRTLQLWADFVERQPWNRKLSRRRGTHLKREWHVKILPSSEIQPSETHESHDDRVRRWRKFLEIPFPEVKLVVGVTEGTYTSHLTTRSTAQKSNGVTGLAESSKPDYTPSKPPRPATEDTAETVKSAKPNISFAESLNRSSSSNEIIDLTEQDSHSTAHKSTINLPYRTKNGKPAPNDTATTTTSSLQAKSTSDRTILSPTRKRSSPISPGVCKVRQNTGGSSEKFHDVTPSATKGLSSGPVFGATPIIQKFSTDSGPFSDIRFPTIWRSHSVVNPGPSATSGRPVGIKQSTEGIAPTAQNDLERTHKPQSEARPSETVLSLSHKIPNSATMTGASQLMQSMTELATCLLAKEVRPLPAREISADIWQFRWPLACSIAFALHSPHIPAGLSFLMWSVFLPFFVAELRGWAVMGRA